MESETAILQKLNHPNVVGYEMRFFTGGFMCLILELCSHGTLLALLKHRRRLIEAEARVLAVNFIAALSYLQKQGVLHRDLKLANLLLADGPDGGVVLKLGDFGLAVQFKARSDERRWTLCGTPNFIAPEVIDSRCPEGYGYAADVWSLGIVLYTMLIGSMPFSSSTRDMLFSKIQACDIKFPDKRTVSSKAKDLIRFILKKNPAKRPTLESIRRHPFFIPGPTALPLISLSRTPTPHEMAFPVRKPLTVSSNVATRVLKLSHSSPLPLPGVKRKRLPFEELRTNSRLRVVGNQTWPTVRDARVDCCDVTPELKSSSISPKMVDLPKSPKKLEATSSPWLADFASAIELELMAEAPPKLSLSPQDKDINYVVRWVENARIPGMGFGMKDGSVGALFKDASTITSCPDQTLYECGNDGVSRRLDTRCLPLPSDLEAKVKVVSKLRSYMSACVLSPPQGSTHSLTTVTYFGNTHQAVDFKADHVKAILSEQGRSMTLILPNRPPLTYPIGTGQLSHHPPPGLKENPDRLSS
ncbi:Serine/threonine-protein kinase plk1 [Massospora cicadina]|nr:Serine/threonine-protein kinase plk1 [Massospora cicadina]